MRFGPTLVLLGLVAATPTLALAATCYTEDQRVILTGTIEARIATNPVSNRVYRYGVLKLDRPLRLDSKPFGDIPSASIVSILPAEGSSLPEPWRFAGKHVTLVGLLERSVTMMQPPEALLLFQASEEREAH